MWTLILYIVLEGTSSHFYIKKSTARSVFITQRNNMDDDEKKYQCDKKSISKLSLQTKRKFWNFSNKLFCYFKSINYCYKKKKIHRRDSFAMSVFYKLLDQWKKTKRKRERNFVIFREKRCCCCFFLFS